MADAKLDFKVDQMKQNPASSIVLESKVVEQKLDDSCDSHAFVSGGTGEGGHHSSDEGSDDEPRKFMGTEATYYQRTEVEMPGQEEETKGPGNFDIRFTMSGPAIPYNQMPTSDPSKYQKQGLPSA